MNRPRRFLLAALITVATVGTSAQTFTNIVPPPEGAVDRVNRWVDAVLAHQPGTKDAAFLLVREWPRSWVEELVVELASVRLVMRDPTAKAFPYPIELDGGRPREIRYSRSEREILDRTAQSIKNAGLSDSDLVARAIVLHSDIARLDAAAGELFLFTDGQAMNARQSGTDHWRMARAFGDWLRRADGRDQDLAFWYRATLAHMASIQMWMAGHARRALERFDDDPELLFLVGCLHERLAAPRTQESMSASRLPANVQVRVGSSDAELGDATSQLKRAVERNGAHAEARLHYGRVLTLAGRAAAAIPELRRAATEVKEPEQRYYAQLFLGAAFEANRQLSEARTAYDAAAALFPDAQSPKLALSQLAASRGDRSGAAQALEPLLAMSTEQRADPWWTYFSSCGHDADALMAEASRRLSTVRR